MTNDQRKYLDSLVCERISANEANKKLIDNFINTRNPVIAGALKSGWNADKQDKLAYYIVKDKDLDMPLMFFSLKCGEMHIPLDPAKLKKTVKNALMLLREAADVCPDIHFLPHRSVREWKYIIHHSLKALEQAKEIEVSPWAKEVIEKQLVDGKLTQKAWIKIWKRVFNALKLDTSMDNDKDLNEGNIVRTKETFPAVELVHFCVYDPVDWSRFRPDLTKEEKHAIQMLLNPAYKHWHEMGMGSRTVAKTMFWKFVVPVIQNIRKVVGCEYIYLFAADDDGVRAGSLIQYYKSLGFNFQDRIYVTKPAFDFGCFFMCQKVTALRKPRNEFFKNYNKNQDAKKQAQPEAEAEV